MSKSESSIAVINRRSGNDRAGRGSLWVRVSAFLSLKSPNTQRTYAGVINEWCNYLGAEAGSSRAAELFINAGDLEAIAYRAHLETQIGQNPRYSASATARSSKAIRISRAGKNRKDGLQSTLANATIRKKIAALRRIYRALMAANLGIKFNPFDADRVPPPPAQSGQKRPTEMIDFKLVQRIIKLPDIKTAKGLRDRAVLAVLFGAGLRRGEVVNLRLSDLRTSMNGTAFLNLRATKSKRDFNQALPKWAAEAVRELAASRRSQGARDGDFLFNSFRGKGGRTATNEPISDSGIYKLFKFYCRLAGANHFATPHSARATAITKLLADGISHREVQEFSRHASVQMVEVYDKRRISVDENAAKDLKYD